MMAGPIPLRAPVYVQFHALSKYIEFPSVARKMPTHGMQYVSYAHIPIQFTNVFRCPDEWNPEKYGALWIMENTVEWYRLGTSATQPRDTFWFPFAWASELEDACSIAHYIRPEFSIRLVHALTHEEIPLHVL